MLHADPLHRLPPAAATRSARVAAIGPAKSIEINQLVADCKARGEDVVTLSLGEAFFDLPLFDFAALDRNACNHYTDSRGIAALRGKIAWFAGQAYAAKIDPGHDILVTAGSKIAIFLMMLAVLDPGDEMLVHEPAWLSYPEQAALCGAVTAAMPYDARVTDCAQYFGPRTRLMLLNNPNNPAGRAYTREELAVVVAACRLHRVFLIVDEAYSDFVIDAPFSSLMNEAVQRPGIAVVNSLSKNMGISGWRIGYIVAHRNVIDDCLKLNQHLITCAPAILQHYLAAYFEQIVALTLPQARAVTAKRARIATAARMLGLTFLEGAETFYLFVGIGAYRGDSVAFARELLVKRHVAVVPGSAYGASTDRFVRVSIGTESDERIIGALKKMKQLIDAAGEATLAGIQGPAA